MISFIKMLKGTLLFYDQKSILWFSSFWEKKRLLIILYLNYIILRI